MRVTHAFGGKVYAKRTAFEAGAILVQHKHDFDHLSILASGTVELLADGVRTVLTGPTEIVIQAGKHHGVKALTDGVWYCVHSTDCTDPDKIDHTLIASDSSEAEMAEMVEVLR